MMGAFLALSGVIVFLIGRGLARRPAVPIPAAT
jgi:hypothetical protein